MISTANLVTAIALSYVGADPKGNAHNKALYRDIINTYNTVRPHGYRMSYSDPWCAASWSAWQIMAGNTQAEVPMSASCSMIISDAKKLGIWIEDESVKPQIGWGIIYDWQDNGKGDNTGSPDHIGLIYDVDDKNIYVVEGNKGSGICGKRCIAINERDIRGFVAPKYSDLKASAYKPATAYQGTLPKTVIHYDSEGEDAKALQHFLNWILGIELEEDGQFGKASTNALLVYQKTYSLATDGFFGDISRTRASQIIDAYATNTAVKVSYKGEFPALDKKVINIQKELAEVADELAYRTNSSKAKYPSGRPTAAYKQALAKLPLSGHRWNAWAKKGAICDVFVWTVIRTAFARLGITKGLPARAGLWYLFKWLDKSSYFERVAPENAQAGDIGGYRKDKAGMHGHTFICFAIFKSLKASEKGKVKEASAKQYYPKTTNSLRSRLSSSKKKWVRVWRAKNIVKEKALQKGSSGENVKRLQRYLNWYFKPIYRKDVLKVDGLFGPATDKYLKLFQQEQSLDADGMMGDKTLKKMKEVVV